MGVLFVSPVLHPLTYDGVLQPGHLSPEILLVTTLGRIVT